MTVVAEPQIERNSHYDAATFLVYGTLRGQQMAVTVPGPAAALDEIIRWCLLDPDATGNWQLCGDYSSPVTAIARLRPGLVSESRRIAHLFLLLPGVAQGATLTARCGETMDITELEWLSLGRCAGMPCEICMCVLSQEIPDADKNRTADNIGAAELMRL